MRTRDRQLLCPRGGGAEIEKLQHTIDKLERSIEDLKEEASKAKESNEKLNEEEKLTNLSQEGLDSVNTLAERHRYPDGKYDSAELFSPPRMSEMTKAAGIKGGWSIDDRIEDPVTKRTYDLRNKKDQNDDRARSSQLPIRGPSAQRNWPVQLR